MQPAQSPEKTMRSKKVVVLGATGHTGRFVAAELVRRGIPTILAGRDQQKLDTLAAEIDNSETRLTALADPASLDLAFAGAALVINCAGPFIDTATPVMEAAIRARIHYLDVSAEQRVTLLAFERFSDLARAAGVLFIPSMSFYGGLADLLATAAIGDLPEANEIHVATALDSWTPTLGTRLTGQKNPGKRSVFTHGRLTPQADPPPTMQWDFDDPFGREEIVGFPLTETIVISQHFQVPKVHAFLSRRALDDLHQTSETLSAKDQSSQKFRMEVEVRRGAERRRTGVSGIDIYAYSAAMIVEAGERVLQDSIDATGTVAPGQIFEPREFLASLEEKATSSTFAGS